MNRTMIRPLLPLWIAILPLVGCALEIAEPRMLNQVSAHGLAVTLEVEPAEVAPSGEFTATLSVTNTRFVPVTLTTYSTCLAVAGVYSNAGRVPFEGSWWGCRGALWSHHLEPGQTITRSWEMRARLYAEQSGDPDGVPAPAGSYRVRAEFHVFEIDGEPAELPTVEASLRVR